MTIDEMIAVLQAYRDKRPIQVNIDGEWADTTAPYCILSSLEYRVKPEPREWTARFYADGLATMTGSKFHGGEAVKVREVLE